MNSSNRKQRIRGASLSRWSISLVILGLLSSPPTAVAIERGAVERVREGYVERIERDLALIEGGKIKLVSDVGSIELDTQAGNRLRLIVVKEVDTSDELEAEKAFKAFEVNIQAGSTVRIIGQQVGLSRLQARVRYSLTIPERYDLDLRTGGGGAVLPPHQADFSQALHTRLRDHRYQQAVHPGGGHADVDLLLQSRAGVVDMCVQAFESHQRRRRGLDEKIRDGEGMDIATILGALPTV